MLEDEGELPPPPEPEAPPAEEAPAEEAPPEEEEGEEVEIEIPEPDEAELEALWREGPTARNGHGIHRKVHMKARQTGRVYSIQWMAYREEAYKDSGGQARDAEHEEATLALFQASLVVRAAEFRLADARVGGATLYGWSKEDCLPGTGVLAVESELKKASKAVVGEEDLFRGPPPMVKPKRKKKKSKDETGGEY
mmetsp:Transcript_32919/g.86999  ORF Transcript_32919/g.86999 Transcript_32919/m.86999 type:complete len:195 (+) Transcript_32919:1460-2044(+)